MEQVKLVAVEDQMPGSDANGGPMALTTVVLRRGAEYVAVWGLANWEEPGDQEELNLLFNLFLRDAERGDQQCCRWLVR